MRGQQNRLEEQQPSHVARNPRSLNQDGQTLIRRNLREGGCEGS
uniref:Uncharacterized protein n=1 Tax=Triticum urartu TaxID=4572 RepID=A0A8R7Q595_TRIUA